jgi:hypothetical protein
MSKTYFINNVDSYLGKSLLSKITGPPTDDQDPEARVMCTKLDPKDFSKLRGIKKVLKVNIGHQRKVKSQSDSSTISMN